MRKVLGIVAALAVLSFGGCAGKKHHKPSAGPAATQTPKEVQAPKKEKPQEKKEFTKEEKKPVKPVPVVTPGLVDKKKLEACYLEVYCAQKRGDMAKILDIYKKYGFQTPQQWTRAWLEAAKDRDWVSEIARKASKACKKK